MHKLPDSCVDNNHPILDAHATLLMLSKSGPSLIIGRDMNQSREFNRGFHGENEGCAVPICSMYRLFTYIWEIVRDFQGIVWYLNIASETGH